MTDWRAFDEALEKYNGAFWWRDDDAISDTASLHQLINLADSVGAPLTLAVIPANLDETLPKAIVDRDLTVAVHGWSHTNHAPEDEKKAEFRAHRPEKVLLDEAKRGKSRLDDAFGSQSLPLFIPPWNRMDQALPLAGLGFQGISVFGQREITQQDGLVRFDAHIDPIDWRGTRSAVNLEIIINELIVLMSFMTTLTARLKQSRATWASASDFLTRAAD